MQLTFGYNRADLPEDRPVWGCRAILKADARAFPLDFIWDRKSVIGEVDDALRTAVEDATEAAQKRVLKGLRNGSIDPRETSDIKLFDDGDEYVCWGRAAGGYMYLCVWSKP